MKGSRESGFPPYECRYCGKRKHVDRTEDFVAERVFACGVIAADCTDGVWWSKPKTDCINKLRKRLGMSEVRV